MAGTVRRRGFTQQTAKPCPTCYTPMRADGEGGWACEKHGAPAADRKLIAAKPKPPKPKPRVGKFGPAGLLTANVRARVEESLAAGESLWKIAGAEWERAGYKSHMSCYTSLRRVYLATVTPA